MITINKKVRISKTNQKIEFELENLPEGEYNVQLVIDQNNNLVRKVDFSAWESDINIPPGMTFSREEIYGDDGR